MKKYFLLQKLMSLIIGIISLILAWKWFEWKLSVVLFLIVWSINLFQDDYYKNKLK